MSLDLIRDVFRKLDQEIWIVTAADTESQAGLTATLVAPASIVPALPRVLVGLGKQHHTTAKLLQSGTFVLNLLDTTQSDLAWCFGLRSGHTQDKWGADVAYSAGPNGDPVLQGVSAWLGCRLEQEFDIGDRWLIVAEVFDGNSVEHSKPLTLASLLASATPTQRAALLRQQETDASLDAQRINQWRRSQAAGRSIPEAPA